MRRVSLLALIGLILWSASPAGAAPPITETEVEKDVVETFVEFFTCDPADLYEITTTSNLIEHITEFGDGRVHVTFTQTGTFEAEPLDASALSASGRFAVWGGFNDNGKTVNGTFTFNVVGEYEDGTRISTHSVDHFNVRPDGTENFFSRCRD